MFKIKKVYIENFKGIKFKQIIDFESADVSILNGPNGFGKTTIFDVIELCLSGKLERTMSFRNVTKNTINHKKPFYQNSIGRDVVLKILIYNESTGDDHIIVKRLRKEHDGKIGSSKSFKIDAWDIIDTYHFTDAAAFEHDIDFNEFRKVDQHTIDRIFYSSEELSLSNLYPLFNYLQQEENIYFLKKDEDEKKDELNFLFQTQREAAKVEELASFLKNIRSLKKELQEKINVLGSVLQRGVMSYQYNRLFPSKEIGFDREEPFVGINAESLPTVYDGFVAEISRLEEFIQYFDILEYNKDKLRISLTVAAGDNSVLNAFCLQHFLNDENFRVLQELYYKRERFIGLLDNYQVTDGMLLELGLDQSFIDDYRNNLKDKIELENNSGVIEKIISELNTARESTIDKFLQLNIEIIQGPNCPLCNSEWTSISDLLDAVVNKTAVLKTYNATQIDNLQKVNEKIKTNFTEIIRKYIESFLTAPENLLDTEFYLKVVELRGFKDRISRFMVILRQNGIDLDGFILRNQITNSQMREHLNRFVIALRNAISDITVDQGKLVNKQLFRDLFDEDINLLTTRQEIEAKRLYLNAKYNTLRSFSLELFNSRLSKLEEVEYKVDNVKTGLSIAVKKYKSEMIKRIKIPFYVYSGKILQNHQQGLGIFMDINEATSRIKFLTDHESDHDIIHHLSSGQLAVVSIAFCLSLNKVYQAPNLFKFLAIDDPVQTLDEINVHSFIELIRHDFNDYQIIMSTHEDDIAGYIQYKFRKFGINCQKLKVQDLFFSSKE